jgi:hypothetical protein
MTHEEILELARELNVEPWEAASLIILASSGPEGIDLADAVMAGRMPLLDALHRAVLSRCDMSKVN